MGQRASSTPRPCKGPYGGLWWWDGKGGCEARRIRRVTGEGGGTTTDAWGEGAAGANVYERVGGEGQTGFIFAFYAPSGYILGWVVEGMFG